MLDIFVKMKIDVWESKLMFGKVSQRGRERGEDGIKSIHVIENLASGGTNIYQKTRRNLKYP